MDISIQAVEEQWTIAAAKANTAGETTALMRAQLIATLLAAGYGTPTLIQDQTIIYTPPAETVEGIPVPGGVLIPDPDPDDDLDQEQADYEAHVADQMDAFDENDVDDFFAEAKAVRKKR